MKKSSFVKIGHSDVLATPLGLGTNAVGGYNLFPNLKDDDGRALVRRPWIMESTCLIQPTSMDWATPKNWSAK